MSHRDTPELRDGQKLTANNTSETPRTDAVAFLLHDQGGKVVSANFARQLELELSQERERGRGLERDAKRWRHIRERTYMDSRYGRGVVAWSVEPNSSHQGEAVKVEFEKTIDAAIAALPSAPGKAEE